MSDSAVHNRRPPPSVDQPRIEAAVREILLAIGEDPEREGLRETPARVARMYAEVFSGLRKDPREHLRKTFAQKYDEVVLVRDIRFASFCEHHLLPFMGKAHVAYLPSGRIVGLSKLARVVEVLARRPQVQERMTEDLADLLMRELEPKGVAVILEASHSCMTLRGVRNPDSLCTTSAMRGAFRENALTRSELMALIFGGGRYTMPVDFCLRLALGMMACLLILSPRATARPMPGGKPLAPPSFFRTHFLVVLALACGALLLSYDSTNESTNWPLLVVLGSAALTACLGSVSWSLERSPGGLTLIGLTIALLLVGLFLRTLPSLLLDGPSSSAAWIGALSSAALLGSAISAMLMGHSYLIAPTMSLTPLYRLLAALAVALALRMLVDGYAVGHSLLDHSLTGLDGDAMLWLPVRWLVGLVMPLVLCWMAWQTARIRSTQSATGILYVVVIFCFLGELTGLLLRSKGLAL